MTKEERIMSKHKCSFCDNEAAWQWRVSGGFFCAARYLYYCEQHKDLPASARPKGWEENK